MRTQALFFKEGGVAEHFWVEKITIKATTGDFKI